MSLKEALKKISVEENRKCFSCQIAQDEFFGITKGSSFERELDLLCVISGCKPVSVGGIDFDKQQVII